MDKKKIVDSRQNVTTKQNVITLYLSKFNTLTTKTVAKMLKFNDFLKISTL